MSSSSTLPAVRKGSQEPSFRSCPPYTYTEGDAAAWTSAYYGLTLDPWQRDVLDDWLAETDNGELLNVSCILMVPRQNGKNAVLEARELYGLAVRGERILHTAHEYQAAKAAFERFLYYFGSTPDDPKALFPDLNRLLKRVTRSAGQMIVTLKADPADPDAREPSIEFRTRTNDGGRGQTVDLLVVDEAQEYTDSQSDALSSVNSAAPLGEPQTIYTGTPPDPTSSAEVFTRLHVDAHEHDDPRGCCHEWGVTEVGDTSDRDRWYQVNPALGTRLKETHVAKEFQGKTPQGFARERLGWWPETTRAKPISERMWERCAEPEPGPEARVSFGVKFSADGETCALAVANHADDGTVHLELVDVRPATGASAHYAQWLKDRRSKLCAVAIDGVVGAPTLVKELMTGEDRLTRKSIFSPSSKDYVSAVSMFYEAVKTKKLTHFPSAPLDASATGCVRRPVGRSGGWGFGGTDTVDATPVEACALAFWAAKTTKRDMRRRRT